VELDGDVEDEPQAVQVNANRIAARRIAGIVLP
jgi:hypothetical protein